MKAKKILCGALLSCSALLLIGCGSNNETKEEEKKIETQTITCVTSAKSSSYSYTYTYNFIYNKTDKVISSGTMITSFTYPEKDTEIFENIDYCEDYEDEDSVLSSCNSTKDENSVTTTYDLNLDNLEKATKDKNESEQFKKTYTIEELETYIEGRDEADYTCTIK